MWRRCWLMPAVLFVVGGLFAVNCRTAAAIGYYNLPGSFCQCFGYGNGAGHHACLVLGPSSCGGCCATNEVRLQCAPQPPYQCYGGQCGAMDQGSWLGEPTMLRPVGPEHLPPPAAMRPQVFH